MISSKKSRRKTLLFSLYMLVQVHANIDDVNDEPEQKKISSHLRHLPKPPFPPHLNPNPPPDADPFPDPTDAKHLLLKLCGNRCRDDCIHFLTPLKRCYNGQSLFPDHFDVWGDYDIYDVLSTPNLQGEHSSNHVENNKDVVEIQHARPTHIMFHRYFFTTMDSSCGGEPNQYNPEDVDISKSTDGYKLPLDQCIGPFGPPRPWGMFEMVLEPNDDLHMMESNEDLKVAL